MVIIIGGGCKQVSVVVCLFIGRQVSTDVSGGMVDMLL